MNYYYRGNSFRGVLPNPCEGALTPAGSVPSVGCSNPCGGLQLLRGALCCRGTVGCVPAF